MPDGPLADPGVRYSRNGLVKRARTQKGWGDHFGASDRRSHDFRIANLCQRTGRLAQPHNRDSNPVSCFKTLARKMRVIARGHSLTDASAEEARTG